MKKFFKITGFLLLLIFAVAVTYNIYKLKDTNGGPVSAIHCMKNIDPDTVDVFFMGTSHVYCGITPGTLWEHSGIASYDLSVSGMDLESTYYTLKYYLKEFSPKVVFVDVYGLTFDGYLNSPNLVGNKYRNLIQLPASKESVELVNKWTSDEEKRDYLLRFPIVHTRYKELTENDFVSPKLSGCNRGEEISLGMADYADYQRGYEDKEAIPMSTEHIEWLERMKKLSEEKGFDLVFIRIPFTTDPMDKPTRILNGFKKYADENGYKYLDIQYRAARLGISVMDFGDPTHLNSFGAKKVSEYMAEYIDENYSLEDHRGDERYTVWEKDALYLDMCLEKLNIKNSKVIDEPLTYLEKIQNLYGLTNVVIYRGPEEEHYGPVEEYLEELGISFDEYIDGGVWVIEGERVTRVMSMQENGIFYYDLADDLGLRVENGEDNLFSLKLNAQELETRNSGVVVYSYDIFGNEMVESVFLQ